MEIITWVFLLYGLINLLIGRRLEQWYIGILIFFFIKMVTNYRKCTISYLECKIRNVKKEEGFLNKFINSILNLRDSSECGFIYTFAIIILWYHYLPNMV